MANDKKSVLVTGGNGFIASHILAQLLEVISQCGAIAQTLELINLQSSYGVTASVRSEAKVQQLLTINPTWEDKVRFGFVPELTAPNAFDKLFDQQYDYIIHTASPVAFKVNDIQKDLIDPAVEG